MELLDTSSDQCKIAITENKKYVVRYPRDIGVPREYFRSTPECEILDLLMKKGINVPKTIKKTEEFFVQEYVEGDLLSDIFLDHHSIEKTAIDQIVSQICLLTSIDYEPLLSYSNWADNRSFYIFQCQNTRSIFKKYIKDLKGLYEALGISLEIIDTLLSMVSKIDNNRSLSIIHGDRHKKNAILQENGELVFIDWELGCVGDLAYEIAFHLHQMAYTLEDEEYFFKCLKEKYSRDFESLYSDIQLYRLFVLARSCIYHVYWTDLLYRGENEAEKRKQLGHFMRRYNRLSKYPEFNLSYKSEDELDSIFKNFKEAISPDKSI